MMLRRNKLERFSIKLLTSLELTHPEAPLLLPNRGTTTLSVTTLNITGRYDSQPIDIHTREALLKGKAQYG
jgi:hypothetical protein